MAEQGVNRTLVILDPGSTHRGCGLNMYDLIQLAKDAGADVVKFQWTSDPGKLCARRNVPDNGKAYGHIAFPGTWIARLKAMCDHVGIEFACTVYLPEDVAVVAPFVKRFKVASFEAGNAGLLREMVRYEKPIIVSTGMADQFELAGMFRNAGLWGNKAGVFLLHCVSAYPTPVNELNLSLVSGNKKWDGMAEFYGFSDHSGDARVGGLAVAAGASIIEAHFRLDDCPPDNPDYPHSLSPAAVKEYVAFIRFAEAALGDGRKRCMPSEEGNRKHRAMGG